MQEASEKELLKHLLLETIRTREILLKIAGTIPELKDLEKSYEAENRESWKRSLCQNFDDISSNSAEHLAERVIELLNKRQQQKRVR